MNKNDMMMVSWTPATKLNCIPSPIKNLSGETASADTQYKLLYISMTNNEQYINHKAMYVSTQIQ